MSNFLVSFIKKKFVEPALEPLKTEIKKKDEIIKTQQDRIEGMPRLFESPNTYNLVPQFKRKFKGAVDFKTLRQLSERYDVARACINRRKRQVQKTDWHIIPSDPKTKPESVKKKIDEVTTFFQNPCGVNSRFRRFVDRIVEDLLVLDAVAIWKEVSRGGKLLKLVNVDAATIRLKINEDGSTPEPPEPAYEQVINGEVVARFTTDELIYDMMNPRTNTPYGLSPIESLILGIDAALRSQLYNLSMLTEGNVPEGFFSLPETWSPEQIREFQTWFDAQLAGNPKFQQRIKFMPGGKGVGLIQTKKPEDMKYMEYELFLLKKTCALFDVQPQEIGFTMDVNKATGEVQQEIQLRTGLEPLLNVLKEIFDNVIANDIGLPELEWEWVGLDRKDELRDAEKTKLLAPLGFIGGDEWRQQNDLEPIGLKPYIMTKDGPVFVEDLTSGKFQQQKKKEKEEKTANDSLTELNQWKRKVLNDFRKGRKFRKFEAKFIDDDVKKLIEAQLKFVKSRSDIGKVFDEQIKAIV